MGCVRTTIVHGAHELSGRAYMYSCIYACKHEHGEGGNLSMHVHWGSIQGIQTHNPCLVVVGRVHMRGAAVSSRVVRGSWIGEKIGCVKKKKATASPGSSVAGAHTARLNQWCSSHPPKDPSGPADSTIDGAAYARSTLLPPGPPWCIVSRPHSAPTPRRRRPPGGAHSHKDGGSHHPPGC